MASNLPDLGSKIDYDNLALKKKFDAIKGHVENLRSNIDIMERLKSQVGPEAQFLLGRYGPKGMRKAINNGQLTYDVNLLRPYLGFRYKF